MVVIIIIEKRNEFPQNGINIKTPPSHLVIFFLRTTERKNSRCGKRQKFALTFCCARRRRKNIKCQHWYPISITIITLQQTTRSLTFFRLINYSGVFFLFSIHKSDENFALNSKGFFAFFCGDDKNTIFFQT